MTSNLTLKEKILLDPELRPLKAITIPQAKVLSINGVKTSKFNGEVIGPNYRGGLASIISKAISNTGALIYTVKWNDGRFTKVTPNSLRTHYYPYVESFEYAQFQQEEGELTESSGTEDVAQSSVQRETRSRSSKRHLRSSGEPLNNDMIDSDDAVVCGDMDNDSASDTSLSDTLSVDMHYQTRRQPKRKSTTQKVAYSLHEIEHLTDSTNDDSIIVTSPHSKRPRHDDTKNTLLPALRKVKKPTNIQIKATTPSFISRHKGTCCACGGGGKKVSADGSSVVSTCTKTLVVCRYCTNSSHPSCCKHSNSFKAEDSSTETTLATSLAHETTNDTELVIDSPTSVVVDSEQQKLMYHICKKCIHIASKSDQHELGDCEKCHKSFVRTKDNNYDNLLFRCNSCERALCGDCMPTSWTEKRDDDMDSDSSDKSKPSDDQKTLKRSWNTHVCSTCEHFDGRKVEKILTWRRADNDNEPTMTTLPIVNATELECLDSDSIPSLPSDDITDYPLLDPSTASQQWVFLVKWENISYRHLDWVPGSWIDGTSRKYHLFIQKHAWRLPRLLEDVVPRTYKTIDRILDVEKTESGRIKKVFAKFDGRPYDEACWDTPPFERELRPSYLEALRYYRMIDKIDSPINMAKRIKDARSALNPADFGRLREYKTQPPYVTNGELLPHQLDGINWFQYQWELKQPCILADDMGLGKTIQVITFLDILFNKYKIYPFAIVVPNSTLTNWVREFNKWAPDMAVVPYFGSARSRKLAKQHEIFKHGQGNNQISCHVVVMTYESALADLSEFSKVNVWPYLVVDEAQRLKNNESLLFSRLRKLKTDNRILLTGTPLQNNMGELINIMNFVDPHTFDDPEALSNYYANLNHQTVQELHRKLKPYFLRRTKDIVLKDLPPKKELIVPLSMTRLQKELYKDHLMKGTKFMAQLRQKKAYGESTDRGGKPARQNYNNLLMSLRKILNHPYLINGVEVIQKDAAQTQQAMVDACGKLKLLHMMLPKLFADGHRVLLFSTMAIALDVLEDYLVGAGISFVRVDGNTSQIDRVAHIDTFNAPDSEVKVFLLTIRAGGVGINLATADTVILYDSDFNPHADLQAIARAHRFGQKHPVLILRLMTRLTVEERILEKCKKKMVLDHLVVDKMDDEELESDDVESILKIGLKALFDDDDEEVASITYTSADVDKLLDREAIFATDAESPEATEVSEAIGEKKDETGGGNMSFSFAKIWQTGERDNVDADESTVDKNQQDQDVWEKLLEENQRLVEEEVLSTENLGRGARKRKAISYTEVKTKNPDQSAPSARKTKKANGNPANVEIIELGGDNDDNSDEEFKQAEEPEDDDDTDTDTDEKPAHIEHRHNAPPLTLGQFPNMAHIPYHLPSPGRIEHSTLPYPPQFYASTPQRSPLVPMSNAPITPTSSYVVNSPGLPPPPQQHYNPGLPIPHTGLPTNGPFPQDMAGQQAQHLQQINPQVLQQFGPQALQQFGPHVLQQQYPPQLMQQFHAQILHQHLQMQNCRLPPSHVQQNYSFKQQDHRPPPLEQQNRPIPTDPSPIQVQHNQGLDATKDYRQPPSQPDDQLSSLPLQFANQPSSHHFGNPQQHNGHQPREDFSQHTAMPQQPNSLQHISPSHHFGNPRQHNGHQPHEDFSQHRAMLQQPNSAQHLSSSHHFGSLRQHNGHQPHEDFSRQRIMLQPPSSPQHTIQLQHASPPPLFVQPQQMTLNNNNTHNGHGTENNIHHESIPSQHSG